MPCFQRIPPDRSSASIPRPSKANPSLRNPRHHRQSLLSLLSATRPLPPTEIPFITHILSFDAKNYHVWTYRQWLCRRYAPILLPLPTSITNPSPEIEEMEKLLNEDCRNNSAWSHRYFVVFGHEELTEMEKGDLVRKEILDKGVLKADEEVVERELAFAKGWIELAPQNPSPWNYLKGALRRAGRPVGMESSVRAL
jgi:protein farnesyltransferase/geranylgeranyltransferase type-1 subunit alpha